MRIRVAVVAALLMCAACSSNPQVAADPDVDASTTPGNAERRSGVSDKGKDRRQEQEAQDKERGASKDRAQDEHRTKGSRSGTGASRETLAVPSEGSYSYAQTGWEEVCQASSCDRSDLPPTQSIEISVTERSAERARFTSRSEGSGSRSQTITYEATQGLISVTELENRFTTGGFTINTVIVPDPPIKAASLPWTVGEQWSGSWKDQNDQADGSYRFEVVGTEQMTVGSSEVTVFVVDTSMELSGEYEGTNQMRLWVTRDDFTIVSSKGTTKITSRYGTYRSRFATSYRSGPRG